MLQDIIRIKPQSQTNYQPEWYEFATPVVQPRSKAQHYFKWALIFHARRQAAEAYKYYEKAIIHHKKPLYLRQMALLHHEMGYLRDAMKYMRTALDLEKREYQKKQNKAQKQREHSISVTYGLEFHNNPGMVAGKHLDHSPRPTHTRPDHRSIHYTTSSGFHFTQNHTGSQ